MELSQRELNRATLARQLLLDRTPMSVVDAVHRVVALQAQEPASPYIALWNRIADFDPVDLDTAFRSSQLVKASLMRVALHAVDVADYPVFHTAITSTLRASRVNDRRFTSTGLSAADADALVPHLIEFTAQPRSGAEIEAMLADRLGMKLDRGVWWALKTFAPLAHSPTGGPWSFGPRNSYVKAPVEPARGDPRESVQQLVWRYLEGFGPATQQDFAQFALLRNPTVRPAFEGLERSLRRGKGPSGVRLFDVPEAPIPDDGTPAPPRLMAMWDSVLLAYADRSRVIPSEYRQLVIRRNGDVLATLLVDGFVAGVWRPVENGIEVVAFRPLDDATWDGVEHEAKALLSLLESRQTTVYGRYGHWWDTLPRAQVVVVAG
jgi:hypothetical protein